MSEPTNKTTAPISSAAPAADVSVPDLKIEGLLVDPSNAKDPQEHVKKWQNVKFRVLQRKMDYAVELTQRYLAGDPKTSKEKVQKAIEAWKASPEFESEPANQVVLKNLLAQISKVKETERGKEVLGVLPGGEAILNPPPQPTGKAPDDAPADPKPQDRFVMNKYWNAGLSFRQDTGFLDLMDKVGVSISGFASDQQRYNIRLSLDMPVGRHVLMLRPYYASSRLKGIPGSPIDPTKPLDPGIAWRSGLDFGVVDPSASSHFSSGLGLEFIGISKFAGADQNLPVPSALPRLHFFRQSELSFGMGNLQLGFGSFFNQQETAIALGSGEPLIEGEKGSPVAVASSLFATNSIPWFVVSSRYYWNGIPEFDAARPGELMAEGEATSKIVSLIPGEFLNTNRSRDAAKFATTQVFMSLNNGPLGPKGSRDQFAALAMGLMAFSALDGITLAGNADMQADLLLRAPQFWQKASVVGWKGGTMLWHLVGAATREGDPPYGNIPEYAKNPGSSTDFTGRAHKIRFKDDVWEVALTGATVGLEVATSKKGQALIEGKVLTEEQKAHNAAVSQQRLAYRLVGAGAMLLGVTGFFASGPLAGQACGEGHTLFGNCTFQGTQEAYFAPGQDHGPTAYDAIDHHYFVSTVAASLIPWGATKLFYSPPKPRDSSTASSSWGGPVTARLELSRNRLWAEMGWSF